MAKWKWPENTTGLEFYDLSIPWGHGVANWPYFEDGRGQAADATTSA